MAEGPKTFQLELKSADILSHNMNMSLSDHAKHSFVKRSVDTLIDMMVSVQCLSSYDGGAVRKRLGSAGIESTG